MWYRVVRTICLFVISLRCKVHFVHVGKCRHYCMGTQLEFIIQSVVRIPHLPPGEPARSALWHRSQSGTWHQTQLRFPVVSRLLCISRQSAPNFGPAAIIIMTVMTNLTRTMDMTGRKNFIIVSSTVGV